MMRSPCSPPSLDSDSPPGSEPISRLRRRGFTLIELMIALTGGLLFASFVFMLAKDTTRFYQNELRLSAATQSAVTGFQRLRSDIARAGYLSTPNIRRDPNRCVADTNFAGGERLRQLAALSIEVPEADAGTLPRHGIELMGSYASADAFPIRTVMNNSGAQIFLQPNSSAMARLVGLNQADPNIVDAALQSVFAPGRALRIVDKAGGQQFGIIAAVNGLTLGQPFIQLANAPTIRWKDDANVPCGLRGTEAGSLVNVVQRIRYSIRALRSEDDDGSFAPLFTGVAEAPGGRQELIRDELDWTLTGELLNVGGVPARELVAEYAVGLQFSLTVANREDRFRLLHPEEGADMNMYSGNLEEPQFMPHLIRSVRALLAVRSSAPDRGAPLLGDDGDVALGFYRVPVDATGTRFARVRTLSADIALRNQRNARWLTP